MTWYYIAGMVFIAAVAGIVAAIILTAVGQARSALHMLSGGYVRPHAAAHGYGKDCHNSYASDIHDQVL